MPASRIIQKWLLPLFITSAEVKRCLPRGFPSKKIWGSKAQSAAQTIMNGPNTKLTALDVAERRSESCIKRLRCWRRCCKMIIDYEGRKKMETSWDNGQDAGMPVWMCVWADSEAQANHLPLCFCFRFFGLCLFVWGFVGFVFVLFYFVLWKLMWGHLKTWPQSVSEGTGTGSAGCGKEGHRQVRHKLDRFLLCLSCSFCLVP